MEVQGVNTVREGGRKRKLANEIGVKKDRFYPVQRKLLQQDWKQSATY